MRKLIVHEFMSLDGVMQAPGGKDEDRDGGFEHGGWTTSYWHDGIGEAFGALMRDVDAFLLGRHTYVTHAEAFELMPPGDPFATPAESARKSPSRGAPPRAIEIFQLNVRAFPNSANVNDSMGEAYLSHADTALAVINHRRSLELDPNNGNAADILKRLAAPPR